MLHTPSPSMRQGGFALAVVLLMTMLTLVVIVVAVSVGTGRSSGTGRASAQSDQALLAAQSGLDSFIPRAKAGGFSGSLYTVECWVEGYSTTGLSTGGPCATTAAANLTTQLLGSDANGPRNNLDIIGTLDEAKSTFTLRSTGKVGADANAAQVVLTQRVKLLKPSMLNVAPPAALTSCPSIKGGGSATIDGGTQAQGVVPLWTGFTNSSTRVRVSAVPGAVGAGTAWPATISMTLSDPTLTLGRGNYVSVNGRAFRVEQRKTDTEIIVSAADTTPPTTSIDLSGDLSLIPFAQRQAITATGQTATVLRSTEGNNITKATYHVPFSDPSGVYVGDVLYVPIPDASGTVTTYAVTVTAKGYVDGDVEQGYVEVALSVTKEATNLYNADQISVAGKFKPPTAAQLLSLKPGTAFSRYVSGATSRTDINGQYGTSSSNIVTWQGAATVGPAAIASNPSLDCASEDATFKQIFNGLTPAAYYDYVPTANRFPAFSTLGGLRGGLYWYGPASYPSNNGYSFSSSDLCGSGVLIVNGNLDMQGTCNQGFTGVLYVMGDLKNAGNGTINGAVVVQGVSTLSQSSFTGSLNILFNQTAIARAAKDLSKPVFTLEKGSWSQQ